MGIRDALNENPKIVTGAAVALIVVVGAIIAFQAMPHKAEAPGNKYFYTADDGKTRFEDDANLVPPILRDGKTIVRARVFECAKEGKFIGYLEKFDDAGKQRIEALIASKASANRILMDRIDADAAHRLVKKPGDAAWVKARSPAGEKIMTIKCADGEWAMPVEP